MECMFKLSQYADDTSIISNGTSESKDGTLRVLDYFTDLSGLIINYTKLKWFEHVVWEGRHFQDMYFTIQDGNWTGLTQPIYWKLNFQ